ncbi:esterase [Talaromyces atroroseus]|uniref:Esterase n=1 Tax=Talaromyces atroroseus TaxID=1441469 RepID=A0A225AC19_TALAT|nr:esterase [Talaromyces atroroseus]OKL58651.1 esterase [Talaromyces atroroseus]
MSRTMSGYDPDLDLPRILCLHGGGTNARIFRSQCRVLSTHLKGRFRLVFAEAPLSCNAGPDVLSVYKEWGPFKSWIPSALGCPEVDNHTAIELFKESLDRAMDEDDDLGATGPWVGLLGFSQGAKMCASLLFLQQLRQMHGERTNERLDFRFGVLLAGRAPLVALDMNLASTYGTEDDESKNSAGIVDPNGDPIHSNHSWLRRIRYGSQSRSRLHIPTVHVHGLRDAGLPLHRKLFEECCEEGSTRLMEWEGDHRVPIKTKDVTVLVQHILAMAIESDAVRHRAIVF